MPRMDGTGPLGNRGCNWRGTEQGSARMWTAGGFGRGLGYGRGRGFGCGLGYGRGRGFGRGLGMCRFDADSREVLNMQKTFLQKRLEAVEKKIQTL